MQLFDTHAHIGLVYDDPMQQLRVIQEAKKAGVTRLISICNSLHDFTKVYATLKAVPGIYHAVGVAPSEVTNPGRNWIETIENNLKLPNVIAIGETGLDYGKKYGDKRSQIELFITQLDLAAKHNLPVIIHTRDDRTKDKNNKECGNDILDILYDRIPPRGAIFHCYSEDAEYASRALDLNVYFSFAGNLTYKGAENLHETVLNIPLDRILIETESPFMIPTKQKHEGKSRTMPAYLISTAKFLAELLDMDLEELSIQLWENSCKAFNLPE